MEEQDYKPSTESMQSLVGEIKQIKSSCLNKMFV